MILHRLTLSDFRQFSGRQSIAFADGSDGRNVTVVLGENGRGKTGVFRAMMFGLFGDRVIAQDENVDRESVLLVNSQAARGCQARATCAEVVLEFSAGDTDYNLSRSLLALVQDETQREDLDSVSLGWTDRAGEHRSTSDVNAVRREVERLISKGVRDYFLFDGERIERLMRAGPDQRGEVRRGIRRLLDLEALETAHKAACRVEKQLSSGLDASTNVEYIRVKQTLDGVDLELEGVRAAMSATEDELAHARAMLQDTETKLAAFEEIREFVDELGRLGASRESCQSRLASLPEKMRAALPEASLLLLLGSARDVHAQLDRLVESGAIPSSIRRDFVAHLLEEGRCICGTPLVRGSDCHNRLLEWHERAGRHEVDQAAIVLKEALGQRSRSASAGVNLAQDLLRQHGECVQELDSLHSRIGEVESQMGARARGDAEALSGARSRYQAEIDDGSRRLGTMEERERALQAQQTELREALKRLGRDMKVIDLASRRAHLATEIKSALASATESFTAQISTALATMSTEYLHRLLDQQGRQVLKEVVVERDHSLQVHTVHGQRFLANISAGQRQVMSVAFICALIRLGSAEESRRDLCLEMPLFMDTPFGRLSYEHRRNLLAHLPELCAQWVLFVTDTEFRQDEAEQLRSSGRWGRFYTLDGAPTGCTAISEHDPDDYRAVLGGRQ